MPGDAAAGRHAAVTDPRRAALAAIAGAVVVWSLSNVAIKATSVTGLVASFWRLWIAAPVLWLSVLATPAARAELDAGFRRASLLGGTLFGLHQILFFSALKLTSVATVSMIGALQPALVLVAAGPLFGERITRTTALWTAVALAGTVLVVVGGAAVPGRTLAGDLIATANLVVFTSYFLASKHLRMRIRTLTYVCGLTTVAGVVVGLAALVHGDPLGSPHGLDWLLLVFIALVPGTLGHLLINWAHPHAPAMISSVMLLGVPVLSPLLAMALLAEPLGALQLAGGVAVLAAVGRLVTMPPRTDLAEGLAEADAP
jgi:drug/metabolite transporter (DMT)-like permease